MKFILALALSGLVSCIGATSLVDSRELAPEDSYWVGEPTVTLATVASTNDAFAASFPHNDANQGGSGWAGKSYIYLFKNCPHGDAQAQAALGVTATSNYLGTLGAATGDPAWISVSTPKNDGQTGSTITFRVLPTISQLGPPVWTLADGVSPDTASASFCVWFGIGPGSTSATPNTAYGFRELILTAEFSFADTFACISLTTQAYDPTNGLVKTNKAYTCGASLCSSQPSRPGQKVCVQLCPNPSDNQVLVTAVPSLYQCEKSNPDTTAGDAFTIISATAPATPTGQLGAIIVKSTDSNAATEGVVGGCVKVWYDLPSYFYPTINSETAGITNPTNPNFATFDLCGTCTIRPVATLAATTFVNSAGKCCNNEFKITNTAAEDCNSGNGVSPCPTRDCCQKDGNTLTTTKENCVTNAWLCAATGRRELSEDLDAFERMLQSESSSIQEEAAVTGTLSYPVLPAEESSSKTVVAGAAAVAAAVGAALML